MRISDVKKALAAKMAISIITMCPALMLAARRNERVIDRTETLVDSTSTRKGFSHEGAPPGRRAAMNAIGEEKIDERMSLSQSVHPKEKVSSRWLEALKT